MAFPDQTHKSSSVPFPYSNFHEHKKKSLFVLLLKYMHFNPSVRKGHLHWACFQKQHRKAVYSEQTNS